MSILTEIQSKVKVAKTLTNSFGNYKYRNVESIYEALKPLLAEHKASVVMSDEIVCIGTRFYVKATASLRDEKGQEVAVSTAFAREDESKRGMDLAQLTGSCSSYARKYALGGLFLLDDSKDIDEMDNTANGNFNQKANNAFAKVNNAVGGKNELDALKAKMFEYCTKHGLTKEQSVAFVDWLGLKGNNDVGAWSFRLSGDIKRDIDDFCEANSIER